MASGETKVSLMTFLDPVPNDAKIYVVIPGDQTPYYTTKAALLAGISGDQTLNDTLGFGNESTEFDAIFRINSTKFIKINRSGQSVEVWDTEIAPSAPTAKIGRNEFYVTDASGTAQFYTSGDLVSMNFGGGYSMSFIGGLVQITDGINTMAFTQTGITINGVEYLWPSGIDSRFATLADIDNKVAGLLDLRGGYNASSNIFPTTGGSGPSGEILKGDFWYVTVPGILNGQNVYIGNGFFALIDNPTSSDWEILKSSLGYVPEDSANKSTNVNLGSSNTLYPTQNAVKVYADTKASKSMSAYKMRANNTNASADASEIDFRSEVSQVYTGTITWTGTTAPSGSTNHTYSWIRVGNMVTLRISLLYGTMGSALTSVAMELPSDCPSPLQPSGFGSANEMLQLGSGKMATTKTNSLSAANTTCIRKNAANNGFELVIVQTSGSYLLAMLTITYFTS